MKYIVTIIVGYLLGCVNPAYICGRLHGFDIRTRGSLNAGASNAKVTMGWPYFFICLIYDSSKAVLAYFLAGKLFPDVSGIGIVAGCSAIMGHIFPFYLQFKGGKGFASFVGVVFAINWKVGLIVGAISLVMAYLFNWIVASTLTFMAVIPVYCLLSHQPVIGTVFIIIVCITIVLKHRINFRRISKGEELGINGNPAGFIFAKKN